MDISMVLKMFISIALLAALGLFARLYKALVMEPKRVRSILRKQGISGPPSTFLFGNMLEIRKKPPQSPTANSKTSRNLFMFSLGNTQILYVNRPDLVREITTCTSYDLGKPSAHRKEFGPLLGEGILTANGPTWAHHRKVLAPELYMEKVKGMINLILESTNILLDSWKSRIDAAGGIADINIDEYMRSFSGDVISRACFGSSYVKGKDIFVRLKTLQEATSDKVLSIGLPGIRYIPTKSNREAWALEKEIHALILEVVKERKESGYEKDLLQMVLEGAENGNLSRDKIDHFIVDNCKNIYLAAHEATAIGASWCLMLLASNPEWQTRVRAEVLQICGGRTPDADMLLKMKQLTMVLQETLRLYPSGVSLSREAMKDIKIGGIDIPKGVNLWTMVAVMHIDPEIWGPDALSFNPERFANGIAGACKLPHSYFPFGFGPRLCVGQHLAMVELKILIALLVSNFSFTLSPKYVHSPALKLVIKPEHGVDLLIKKL
ncbi:hypothetical protein F0562_002160 [Nyssa sinensis]|uniref:Cytochrome P450 n=1 Tax=Nyssa sinensis TaxID=561372 RepID=A0A5J5C689_9ASTE|nr:hypothetical protein F0562_002160 [Nyssa sinensis]